MEYDEILKKQYSDLVINIVKHDTSPTGFPCYIEAHLGKKPKDMGQNALDLGNYIYRTTGLRFQMTPEYRGRGKKTTIRWFMSWEDVQPIMENICKAFGKKVLATKHLPFEFNSLIIQNTSRGISAKNN